MYVSEGFAISLATLIVIPMTSIDLLRPYGLTAELGIGNLSELKELVWILASAHVRIHSHYYFWRYSEPLLDCTAEYCNSKSFATRDYQYRHESKSQNAGLRQCDSPSPIDFRYIKRCHFARLPALLNIQLKLWVLREVSECIHVYLGGSGNGWLVLSEQKLAMDIFLYADYIERTE